ncbi:MAG TPA: thioredoxin-like domain-containing protein [Candidatus Eisenbacteria bacterium]|nr:thioredoxin-like domain-containing protein [Candidatus Eisenbacteria bacterium]
MLRRISGLAAAILAGALLHAWAGPIKSPAVPAPADTTARSSSGLAGAVDLAGKPVDPFALSGGKPVVLVFVRTDCPISNRYAPTIHALSKKYSGQAYVMLVYPDRSETPEDIEKHLHEYGYTNTALRDTQHALVKVSKVEITPEAAVFNSEHELIYHGRIDNWYEDFGHARSAPTTHELDDAIQAAIDSKHAAPVSVSGIGCYISDLQ